MFHLVYVSSATEELSADQLDQILTTSRRNNAAVGVTGMLLYKGGNLMQVLEGEEPAVRGVFDRISRDPRHHGVLTLLDESRDHRDFTEWTMAFRNLEDADVAGSPGFSPFLNTPLTGEEFAADPSAAHRLLLSFKRGM